MIDAKRRDITLAIEAAVEGGSLSILENGIELDFWLGQSGFSRAEDILNQIENLFERNRLSKKSLKFISTSAGPGSSTGLKIGLSLAKGLSKATGCPFIQTPVLESLLLIADKNASGSIITAIPIGKKLICWQVFHNPTPFFVQRESQQLSATENFINIIINGDFSQAIFHDTVYKFFKLKSINYCTQTLFINAGLNLAKLLAGKGAVT